MAGLPVDNELERLRNEITELRGRLQGKGNEITELRGQLEGKVQESDWAAILKGEHCLGKYFDLDNSHY
jgi:hypothetical protein